MTSTERSGERVLIERQLLALGACVQSRDVQVKLERDDCEK
jgi:hypothetical protein